MTRRQAAAGAVLSLAFPGIVYAILYAIVELKNRQPQDYAYHDSYFLVMHVGWIGYMTCAAIVMVFYAIAVTGYRFVKRLGRG
ncbi:hypothetical protein [Paenibacillus sp. BC26]|uniref:hypothetical protein n=1 Tax=Paenibacillus sp. BC26 TaxID=1881032 RepID=UPI0008EFFB06|nr:hypothetical protein [Paenibacillus sp. BC26]SFT20043.1 hypothetical protein SAMN05428962_5126 [Paenibacillus sp. BC26]